VTNGKPRLVLASSSPQRRKLLQQLGLDPQIVVPDIDETAHPDERPDALVQRLASTKAAVVNKKMRLAYPPQPYCIVAADTLIVLAGKTLGKPNNCAHGLAMLAELSDAEHEVITGVAVSCGDRSRTEIVRTRVHMGPISTQAALAYWNSGEPLGKAGAYAIQGLGARFVMRLHGSYSNVVGLPLFETAALLESLGYSV